MQIVKCGCWCRCLLQIFLFLYRACIVHSWCISYTFFMLMLLILQRVTVCAVTEYPAAVIREFPNLGSMKYPSLSLYLDFFQSSNVNRSICSGMERKPETAGLLWLLTGNRSTSNGCYTYFKNKALCQKGEEKEAFGFLLGFQSSRSIDNDFKVQYLTCALSVLSTVFYIWSSG